jgi:hypothetical protein
LPTLRALGEKAAAARYNRLDIRASEGGVIGETTAHNVGA